MGPVHRHPRPHRKGARTRPDPLTARSPSDVPTPAQVAIVTGANDGIGFITARELHKKGCKVYLACRNEDKAQDAIRRISEASPGKPDGLVFLPFDLTELKSAEKAAKTVQDKEQRLDIIVCNAGEWRHFWRLFRLRLHSR